MFAVEVVDSWLDDTKLGRRPMPDYERRVRRENSFSWPTYRINMPLLRDLFMARIDLSTRVTSCWRYWPESRGCRRRFDGYGCLYLLFQTKRSTRDRGWCGNVGMLGRMSR